MSRARGGGAFAALLRDVDNLRDRVTGLAETEQRLGQKVNEVVQRAKQAVAAVNGCLDELREEVVEVPNRVRNVAVAKRGVKPEAAVGTREKSERMREPQDGSKRAKKKSKKVVEMEANESKDDKRRQDEQAEQDEEDQEFAKKEKATSPAAVAEKKPPRLLDGMVGKVQSGEGESLVYFSLGLSEKKGLFDCPSMARDEEEDEDGAVPLTGTLSVKRSVIRAVHFSDLAPREQQWYQGQLEVDMLKRFEVNFPVLFANQGYDMMVIKLDLLDDPTQKQAEDLIDRLAQNIVAIKAMSKVSPSLSSANNAALMVASALHKNLRERGQQGWHETYRKLVQDMCERCDLAPLTVERYRKVGEVMLKCDVVACLLPSFVHVVEDVVEAVLNDEGAKRRLNDAFKGRLRTFFAELGDSSVVQQFSGRNNRMLELAGELSPLEVQARNLLLESGSVGVDEGSLVWSTGAVKDVKRQKMAAKRRK